VFTNESLSPSLSLSRLLAAVIVLVLGTFLFRLLLKCFAAASFWKSASNFFHASDSRSTLTLATSSLNLLIPSSFQPSNLLPPFVYSDFGREFRSLASRVLPLAAAITPTSLVHRFKFPSTFTKA
jgi:hypothetical protein